MLRPARNRARPAAPFTRATPPEGLPAGERRSKPRGVRTMEHDSAVKKGAALDAPRKRPAERMKSDPAGPVLCCASPQAEHLRLVDPWRQEADRGLPALGERVGRVGLGGRE